jgi:hypothetical protein
MRTPDGVVAPCNDCKRLPGDQDALLQKLRGRGIR